MYLVVFRFATLATSDMNDTFMAIRDISRMQELFAQVRHVGSSASFGPLPLPPPRSELSVKAGADSLDVGLVAGGARRATCHSALWWKRSSTVPRRPRTRARAGAAHAEPRGSGSCLCGRRGRGLRRSRHERGAGGPHVQCGTVEARRPSLCPRLDERWSVPAGRRATHGARRDREPALPPSGSTSVLVADTARPSVGCSGGT